jgi:hypothetical protein
VREYDSGDLGYQLYRAMTGRKSPNTEPTSFADALVWFTKAAGGNVSAAARLAGVPRRTFRDWTEGKGLGPRSAARRAEVKRSATISERMARIGTRREARLRTSESLAGATVTGFYNYDGKSNDRRPILIGDYLSDNAGDELVDAFMSGASPAELREVFAANLTNDATGFYERTMALPPTSDHGWTVSHVKL